MKEKGIIPMGFLFILGVIFVDCTKDETPTPLPPPVRPVVEQVVVQKKEGKFQDLAKEIKERGYMTAPATGPTDCGSICPKINDCMKDRASSILSKYCKERCPHFSEDLRSSFAGLDDCGKITYNYNRFNCDYGCGLIIKSNNPKIQDEIGKDKDKCIGECLATIATADKGMKTIDCFIGKTSPQEMEQCLHLLGEAEPKRLDDLMK